MTLSFFALATGCVGEAQWLPKDLTSTESPGGPAREIKLNQFRDVSAGLPSPPFIVSAASLDGALYALVKDTVGKTNLFRLPSGAEAWEAVALPVTGQERPTFITRLDFSLIVTAADSAGQGGLFQFSLGDETWKKMSAPNYAGSFVVKRGSEWLWATTQGLFASADRGATWSRRSVAGTALFSQPVRRLVASLAAARLFAVSNAGVLMHSDDSGASWNQGLVDGEVTALVAQGAFVLAETAADGTLRSDNYGGTFHPLSMNAKVVSFATLGNMQLVAATAADMRSSDNGGSTWKTMNVGLPPSTSLSSLAQAGSALLASVSGKLFVAQMEQLTTASSAQ
ncbi:MAG: hypothetical protein K1X64_01275 [Myxococcaceae bacterium]|nr:hypothetical protein [Myxococcaceae bacterium]